MSVTIRGMSSAPGAETRNTVTTDSKGVVTIVMSGKQTGPSMRLLAAEILKQTGAVRAQGKRVLTITDIRAMKTTDSDREARMESKKMLSFKSDAAAIIANPGVTTMLMYLVRVTKAGSGLRFFPNERKARAWLESTEHPKRRRITVCLLAGIFVGLIGLLTLFGWATENRYLMGGMPSLRPMNPMAAVGLLVIAYGFICYWFGNIKQLKIAGIFGVVLGLSALLQIGLDHVLFGEAVRALGSRADLADSAALCFIAIGLAPLTVGTLNPLVKIGQYVLAGAIIGLSLFNIFGQLYAYEFIYGLSGNFVMSITLAVAFLAVGVTMVLLVLYRRIGDVLGGVTRTGWLVVIVLLFVQVATYGAWAQAVAQNKATATDAFLFRGDEIRTDLTQRLDAYSNALYGFKGLFASSDYVDQGEFQSYYDSLNLRTAYPGLRALTYISKVPERKLGSFVAQRQADTSLYPAGNPAFAVTAKSAADMHYLITYSATSQTPGGADLGSNPSRLAAFEKADSLDQPVSSGTVDFAASASGSAQQGFFMTIPVAHKGSNETVGFVNTAFNYADFFASVFANTTQDKMDLQISDTTDGSTVYRTPGSNQADSTLMSRVVTLPVVDHTWSVRMSAPQSYGLGMSQSQLPRTILIGGQLFALLLCVIFVLQARARRQGFALADSITEDLEYERNQAVANDHKSTAILASIGDAVFAVDTKLRVTLFNPSAQRISGFTEADVLGKRYDEVLRFEFEKTGKVNDRFVHDALAGKLTAMANHTVLVCKDGRRVPVADSAAPISDATRRIQGAIIVFRDVTKDYELDKAKSEFVSLASHQLRTPLSAINWYGEMLLSGDAGKLNTDQHEYIQEIFEGNQRMIDLVNSLLDVSRLEVGKLVTEPAPTSVNELIISLEKELHSSTQKKQLVFTKHMQDLPPIVADPKQLRMIVQNLLSNAVKYTTDNGSVIVTLRKATPADMAAAKLTSTNPHWYFSVQDSGYGIPQSEQAKIFTKLYRADNVRKLDVEGTGLGLYIVKEVVKKLGGQVWFTSTENVGTTFYVVAPFKGGRTK